MKSEFNKDWNKSKQPRKQRKFRANAPNHIKRTFMGSTLDKPLREKYGRRTIEVKKGDEVKVMRGKFRGKQGKVGTVDVKNTRIQIDGVQRAKAGGEKLVTWFHPSNVKIIILNASDERRLKAAGGRKPVAATTGATDKVEEKKEEKTEKKTVKKAVKTKETKESKE